MCRRFLLQGDVFAGAPVPSPAGSSRVGGTRVSCCSRCCTAAAGAFAHLCSSCAHLDEIFVVECLTTCLCSLSSGWDDALVCTGTGRAVSKRLGDETVLCVGAVRVTAAPCTGGERTCCSMVNPLLQSHLSSSFVFIPVE